MKEGNHFNECSAVEINQVFSSLPHREIKILLWTKGSSAREKFIINHYSPENQRIYLDRPSGTTLLVNQGVLMNLEFNQMRYFSTSTLSVDENQELYLKINSKVFKGNKRANFRIDSQVIENYKITVNDLTFDGIDLSVGGISFLAPAHLIDIFQANEYQNITIRFNRHQIKIAKACKKYCITTDFFGNNQIVLKVGMQFLDLEEEKESFLFREINNALFNKLTVAGQFRDVG